VRACGWWEGAAVTVVTAVTAVTARRRRHARNHLSSRGGARGAGRGGRGAGGGARGGGSQSHHVAAQLPTPALLPGGVEVEQAGDLAGVLPLGAGDGGPDCDGRETQSV
jgi:hypothetical protein